MIFKIYLEKALDNMEWSFIRSSFLLFNFPIKLVKWSFIRFTLFLFNFSIKLVNLMDFYMSALILTLVNVGKTNFFLPFKGIKQGNCVPSYLIILRMERLFRNINQQVNNKNWHSIKISRVGPNISHLFFIYDLNVFARANTGNYATISATLIKFMYLSGQKVNLAKSKVLYSSNCTEDLKGACSANLYIRTNSPFGTYLELPMFQHNPKISNFQFSLEKMYSKLAG